MSIQATTQSKEESPSQSRTNKRPQRVPLHERDILVVRNKNPNKVYRWVMDESDRLYRFTEAGWEFVTDKGLVVGQPTVNADKELGSVLVKRSGDREMFLMCIDKEWYDEDQASKAEKINETERAMYEQLNSLSDGRYGRVKMGVVSED